MEANKDDTSACTHANKHNTCTDYGLSAPSRSLTSSSIISRLWKWQRGKQQQRKHFLVKERNKSRFPSLEDEAVDANVHGKSHNSFV